MTMMSVLKVKAKAELQSTLDTPRLKSHFSAPDDAEQNQNTFTQPINQLLIVVPLPIPQGHTQTSTQKGHSMALTFDKAPSLLHYPFSKLPLESFLKKVWSVYLKQMHCTSQSSLIVTIIYFSGTFISLYKNHKTLVPVWLQNYRQKMMFSRKQMTF